MATKQGAQRARARSRGARTPAGGRARYLAYLGIWWAWAPVLYGVIWLVLLGLPGHKKFQGLNQWSVANLWSHSTLLWAWLAIGVLGSLVIVVAPDKGAVRTRRRAAGAVAAGAVVLAFLAYQATDVSLNNSKDMGRYYDAATVFYAPALGPASAPDSLQRLLAGATHVSGSPCSLTGAADVPGCLDTGTLPKAGWDPRASSRNGAVYALEHRSSSVQNVSLDTATVMYLNAWKGQPARWSGVMNGHGNGTGMGGVAEWNGTSVTSCDFTGRYAIGRSFGGSGYSDLDDLLAQEYPGLRWTESDVWGYCDGAEPVVVVPMTHQVAAGNRSVVTAAGVVTVRGDDGRARLSYLRSVRPGALPGPVYPASLVSTQLQQASWAAGRRAHDSFHFGYEPDSSAVQAGNTSNYLLRDSATGRLEWVTPLTLNNSTSQEIVAYAVSDADQAASGRLNRLSIYVLASSDPRVINIDTMEANARVWLSQQDPGLLTSGGVLSEFTPLGGNMWRAYLEVKGQVEYLMDFDATGTATPVLTGVGPQPGGGTATSPAPGGSATGVCGRAPSSLSVQQIATCLQQFSDALAQREGTGAAPRQ